METKNIRTLIIGCGTTANDIFQYKEEIKNTFDIVIGTNFSFLLYDDIIDYHIISEKISKSNGRAYAKVLNDGNYSVTTPRYLNYKSIDFYDKRFNRIPIKRKHYKNFNPRVWSDSALHVGPITSEGLSRGTIILQSIHFAGILGSDEIFLIGAEMCFKDQEKDHFYEGRPYRDAVSGCKQYVDIVTSNGIKTLQFWVDSAKYISDLSKTILKDSGMRVYDFSRGIIDVDQKDVNEFFKTH